MGLCLYISGNFKTEFGNLDQTRMGHKHKFRMNSKLTEKNKKFQKCTRMR